MNQFAYVRKNRMITRAANSSSGMTMLHLEKQLRSQTTHELSPAVSVALLPRLPVLALNELSHLLHRTHQKLVLPTRVGSVVDKMPRKMTMSSTWMGTQVLMKEWHRP